MTAATDFKCVAEGDVARILLSPKAAAEYDAVQKGKDERSVRRRTRLNRYFQQFCDCDPHKLNEEQFKREGAFPDGEGNTVSVWEFKAWQWRVYGSVMNIEGRKCFVGVLVDADKKRNKADQAMLRSTAREIAGLNEYKKVEKVSQQVAGGGNERKKRRR